MAGCIGEPISWLRLEQHALAADPEVERHVAACDACRRCLDELRGDAALLRPLVVAARAPRRRWWHLALPSLALAAAALLVIVRRPAPRAARVDVARIKGVGAVVLGVVRARGGVVRDDVDRFAPGDRWKVVVTCPPEASAWIDVAVVEAGAAAADYPLAPARVACGNHVVVPGAFELTGARDNTVCVRVAPDAPPARALPRPGDPGVACVTLRPE